MTSQPSQHSSASTSTLRSDRTASIRFLVAGSVMLAVTIMSLVVLVRDWSAATSAEFVYDHANQLLGVAIGVALVVTGFVKYFRS